MSRKKKSTEAGPSAYWAHVERRNKRGHDGELTEGHDANPDMLPESAGMFASSDDESFRKAMVRKVLEDDMLELLTAIQRQVFELVVFQGMTQQAAADRLGIEQPTVNEHLRVGGAFLRAILQGADPIKRRKRGSLGKGI